MRAVFVFFFFLFLNFLSLHMAETSMVCGTFSCGNQVLKFPFFETTMASSCGLFKMNCTAKIPEIQLVENGRWYEFTSLSQTNTITITDRRLDQSLTSENCTDLSTFSLPDFPWLNLKTLYKCNNNTNNEKSVSNFRFTYQNCREERFYYTNTSTPGCSAIRAPEIWIPSNTNSTNLKANFSLDILLPPSCFSCHNEGGECKIIHGEYQCVGRTKEQNVQKRIKLGLGIGGSIFLLTFLVVLFILIRREMKIDPHFRCKNICKYILCDRLCVFRFSRY